MYIQLSDIQNGEPVDFAKNLGGQEVALCEITYYHQWFNISAALKNSKDTLDGHPTIIQDGYYNVCELDEEVFQPLDAELHLHPPSGRLKLFTKTYLVLSGGLAKFLGFSSKEFGGGRMSTDNGPTRSS